MTELCDKSYMTLFTFWKYQSSIIQHCQLRICSSARFDLVKIVLLFFLFMLLLLFLFSFYCCCQASRALFLLRGIALIPDCSIQSVGSQPVAASPSNTEFAHAHSVHSNTALSDSARYSCSCMEQKMWDEIVIRDQIFSEKVIVITNLWSRLISRYNNFRMLTSRPSRSEIRMTDTAPCSPYRRRRSTSATSRIPAVKNVQRSPPHTSCYQHHNLAIWYLIYKKFLACLVFYLRGTCQWPKLDFWDTF